ncbi:DNA repair protein RecN [candidate division WOR-3 bacterium]|nr:DNA repair protein RecN [candidate division WOR-3 bacterium]
MLSELSIKNIAIIEDLNIDFSRGFNVLTGETGTGKSIIVNSVNLLIGERFDKTMLKEGESFAEVSALFSDLNDMSKKILSAHDIDFDKEIIIRRRVNRKGVSKVYINDTPVTMKILKELGKYLVDLHGQHEHQSLFYPERQRELLDRYGEYEDSINYYENIFDEISVKRAKLKDMTEELSNILQNRDLYEFHLKEIEKVSPKIGEDEELEKIENFIKNRVEINSYIESVNNSLFGQQGAEEKVWSAIESLNKLVSIDSKFADMKDVIEEITFRLEDLKDKIKEYSLMDDEEFPPIDEIEARISDINGLKKKYGGSIESVLRYRDDLVEKLGSIDIDDADLLKLQNEIKELELKLLNAGEELHKERVAAIRKIEEKIPKVLSTLKMKGVRFKVNYEKLKSPERTGLYSYEFYISTNPGETPKPLNKVASGGEISRIMLAFKSLINEKPMVDTIVFDEIDTGIGGDTGYRVGKLMKEIASGTQVITITHLPQVSIFANNHIRIEKISGDDKATVTVKALNEMERVEETARMLGSEYGKESAVEHAKKLLEKAQ